MKILIKNWDKYNPRKDLKSMNWFRIDSDIIFDDKLFTLTAEQKWIWIFILSCAAKKNSESIILNEDYLTNYSGVKKAVCLDAISKLNDSGLIQVSENKKHESVTNPLRARNESVTDPIENVHYETRRDVTNETNVTERESLSEIKFIVNPLQVMDLWNDLCRLNPALKMKRNIAMTARRNKLVSSTTKAYFKTIEDWQDYFGTIFESKFLTGDNQRGWKADFEWALVGNNAVKVLEGNYKNSNPLDAKLGQLIGLKDKFKGE